MNGQFTLTCISTGGPATSITWTRDSVTVTEETETVLNDPVTAQYTHTLSVSTVGVYTCTVSNSKPSTVSASITITGTTPFFSTVLKSDIIIDVGALCPAGTTGINCTNGNC